MERLFSYGTLDQAKVQAQTFGRLLSGAPDALVGFKQTFLEITDGDVLAKSGERFHPIVTRSGDGVDRVAGTVFEITAAELAAADAYEVSDYVRVSAKLASGTTAWMYVQC
ncbi:gamma-glutamylcyclotransferase family protein [Candidatus Viadribacter manganicus]|uniref:UDP-N-acetylmuramate--alanine ligase n=1 Tax=Candidatus Viadribacter manganicus TaxID=1759059 RepID=A0A1B1AM86_9PROT|nr:gamma-glutamylcyclotransferase family protein [Candidatus Viadribacter manganicus]ANP47664.1 UDP-N-acetylmuramate--alanine ligase [Candidatus Viadribacter manganicus]